MSSIVHALALAAAVAAANMSQSISEGELQRLTYNGKYPIGCQEATLAANGLRTKPTTDPARMHEAARTFRACATGPYGKGSDALANQANFNAAAALLLAARHEEPSAARSDATAARTLAQAIADYRRPTNATGRSNGNDPSMLRTDAGRIARDATALLASLPEGAHV